jgi:hypothetical protein
LISGFGGIYFSSVADAFTNVKNLKEKKIFQLFQENPSVLDTPLFSYIFSIFNLTLTVSILSTAGFSVFH